MGQSAPNWKIFILCTQFAGLKSSAYSSLQVDDKAKNEEQRISGIFGFIRRNSFGEREKSKKQRVPSQRNVNTASADNTNVGRPAVPRRNKANKEVVDGRLWRDWSHDCTHHHLCVSGTPVFCATQIFSPFCVLRSHSNARPR